MAEFILKDWYGNNCTFDKDKIFVQDVNGELVEFTQGKGNPTLETLEVTENGTYTPSEGVDGFNSVNVAVPIPEVVLQDKTITENGTFTADEGFDGLGSVTVDVAGSGDSTLKAYRNNVTLTGVFGERVAVNFGFKPFFIMFIPNGTQTIGSTNFIFWGVSKEFDDTYKKYFSNRYAYMSSGKLYLEDAGYKIDETVNNQQPIYGADETGFNIGKTHLSGQHMLFALGF